MTRQCFIKDLLQADNVVAFSELSVWGERIAEHDANQRAEIARLREALIQLLECVEDECRIDHHGYCQNHFVTLPCVVAKSRQALKESRV